MFKEVIRSTSLCTQAAEEYYSSKIYGTPYAGDNSFVSTLRALVGERVKEDDPAIKLNVATGFIFKTSRTDKESYIESLVFNLTPGTIQITDFELYGDNAEQEFIKYVTENYSRILGGNYIVVKKVTEFYRKAMPCVCLIEPEQHCVQILTGGLDLRRYHYLQCGIMAFLPWYFNPEDGIDNDEFELIQSLREKTPDKYIECINKFANKYDFMTLFIKNKLKGFESYNDEARLNEALQNFEYCIKKINDYMDAISAQMQQKDDLNIKILGLKDKLLSMGESSELADYFLAYKDRLILDSVNGREITYTVKDYLTMWDKDFVETALENGNSYFYYPSDMDGSKKISKPNAKKLFTAIFLDETIKIRMCARYSLVAGSRVSALSHSRYSDQFINYARNPHIDEYSCLGGYEEALAKYMLNNDYIGAIEQTIASCRSVNVKEGATMDKFLLYIYGFKTYNGGSDKFFELPDGKIVNVHEAIKWLNSEGEE